MPAFTRTPHKDQIAPATPADVVPPTPQAQTPNVGGTPSLGNAPLGAWTPGPWTLTHVAGINFATQRFELRGMFGDTPNVYPIFNKGTSAIDGTTFCASPEDARLISLAPEMAEALRELMDFDSEAYDRKSSRAIGLLVAKKKASALLSKLKGST